MGKRSVAFALAASLTFVPAPPAAALSNTEACFYNAINAERAKIGRRKLALKADLVSVARRHSERMADDGTIYHNKDLDEEVGGGWWALGENVGMGSSCESLHNAFMDSPGHRANVLDDDYNQDGIGVVIRDGTIYVTVVFAGRPMGSIAPKKKAVAPKPEPAAPSPKPKPRVRPPAAAPRTISMLLLLVGMDARRVDPSNGAALGL